MGKKMLESAFSPFYGVVFKGPKNIKEAYEYEVYGDENSQKRGLFRKKLFALWRCPGEETKGLIDGLIDSATAAGQCIKEFLSIFFSD